MTIVDLAPAAERMTALIGGVPDEMLGGPTPCAETTLGALLHHVGTLTRVFTAAATKTVDEFSSPPPAADASKLGDDWRARIPRDLAALAEAWRDPAAWTGMTKVGGLDLPGEVAGVVALDELVIHGGPGRRTAPRPCARPERTRSGLVTSLAEAASPASPVPPWQAGLRPPHGVV